MKPHTSLSQFTNQYSLSKTLRFELKPIGKDGQKLSEEESEKNFSEILEQDRKIKAAYDAIKPLMDKIHEQIITLSLSSKEYNEITFNNYFEEYLKGKEKKLDKLETELRLQIGETLENTANYFANNAGLDEKGKPIFKKNKDKDVGIKYLTQAGILKFIENNINQLLPLDKVKEFIDKKEVVEKGKTKIEKTGHLAILGSFFTYFTGYNQNRENYYVCKKEAKTAIATRIVHENLPKFCDNILQFAKDKRVKRKNSKEEILIPSRKEEYLNAYQFLKNANRDTLIKDAETQKMIEAKPITEEWFEISKFNECLAQQGIENYNKVVGSYNLLINLYNQARKEEKDFKKMQPFKTLYKQIGCGEKKNFIKELKYDTQKEQNVKEKTDQTLNLEKLLIEISQAGNKFFKPQTAENVSTTTIYSFIEWLKENEDWDGVYWSKAAVDKISNNYFANWHDIKDRIQNSLQANDKEQKERIKAVASFVKKREEQLKINDAVELSGLFEVLDMDTSTGWSERLFKNSFLEEKQIDENLSPSQNLINLICTDMDVLAKAFCAETDAIFKITEYKNEDNILKIKKWLDSAKSLLWLMRYFEVKESKVKGNSINADLTEKLNAILRPTDVEWFDWYDLVRNYLTKKPQDDAKKNKLKLNFENPILLGGWSDGQEKNKGSVLLRNKTKYYIGILINRNIFDTSRNNNLIYNGNDENVGRLILKTLKFQTLAGKGFVRDYGVKYGDLGKENPQEAVNKLQEFIKKHYIKQYPLLSRIANKNYSDKKLFDKEIQEVLTECYECNFTPISWTTILSFIEQKKLVLFELYSKDFSENKGEKSKGSNLNLHTKYWQQIFEKDSTLQLNGGGEIFYREKAIDDNDQVTHPANKPIYRRSDKKTESRFTHTIIKDKRFAANKYFLHIPIKINYQAPSNPKINDLVNDHFSKANDIQFLGLDRGEKHLISYALTDSNGKILKQGHFDEINNKNYLDEINEAAKIRKEKQENWQQKGNIANLKEGYISLVIHEILQTMKDENGNFKPTFIVLEDLNTGFKRSRQKFEQQIYQKFEIALAKKLNYIVDKKAPDGELGSVSKALQLTPPVSNYQDIENRKQVGIMLYTRANYTSVTDPATGWRKSIYLKKGSENDLKRQILENFTKIEIDSQGDYFFQYPNKTTGKTVTLWSGKNGKPLERYRAKRGKDKNEYVVEAFDVNMLLDRLFEDFNKTESLRKQIEEGKELSKVNEHTAWETLRFVIDIIQQIRNTGNKEKKQEAKYLNANSSKNQDENFLQSPVRNEKGEHFDSRLSNKDLPEDADINGAFNIARKGIIMYEHIKQWVNNGKQKTKTDGNETADLDLFVRDEEWDLWSCVTQEWKKHLSIFASKKLKITNNENFAALSYAVNNSPEVVVEKHKQSIPNKEILS